MMSPQHKRKRTLSASADSPVESIPGIDSLTKSTDVYFEDGNIAVVAGNVAFRVHRGQLALHSEVFKDMLTLVTEPQDGEAFDGCPVVRLTDNSQDLAVLLKVMYGQIQFKAEMVDQLISVMRLSTKYLMDPIRTSALEVLAIAYPSSLDQWDAYEGSRERCGDILKLAVDVHADILLPAVYYAMSINRTSKILSSDLPRPLLENVFCGKEELVTKLACFVCVDLESQDVGLACIGMNCSTAWDDLHSEANSLVVRTHSSASEPAADALLGLGELTKLVCAAPLCGHCKPGPQESIIRERERIWQSLPTTFGLGSWPELHKKS